MGETPRVVRFTRSARRHKIGRAHALYVMESIEPVVSSNDRGEEEYVWYGVDDRGLPLTIIDAVVEDDVLLIFHVQPTYRGRRR